MNQKTHKLWLLLLLSAFFLSGCYLGFDRRVGKRSYPNPENNAIGNLDSTVPAALKISNAPLSVCKPILEASDPRGLSTSGGDYKGVLSQNEKNAEIIVQELLVQGLREAGITAKALDHHCEYSFFYNGDTPHYLRSEILYVETNIDFNGSAAVALGLNLSVHQQGGGLLFTGRHGGGANGMQATGTNGMSTIFRTAMRRLLNDVARGRLPEVLR